jgi:hypothetical protein
LSQRGREVYPNRFGVGIPLSVHFGLGHEPCIIRDSRLPTKNPKRSRGTDMVPEPRNHKE